MSTGLESNTLRHVNTRCAGNTHERTESRGAVKMIRPVGSYIERHYKADRGPETSDENETRTQALSVPMTSLDNLVGKA